MSGESEPISRKARGSTTAPTLDVQIGASSLLKLKLRSSDLSVRFHHAGKDSIPDGILITRIWDANQRPARFAVEEGVGALVTQHDEVGGTEILEKSIQRTERRVAHAVDWNVVELPNSWLAFIMNIRMFFNLFHGEK
ncbi:hypothetical protein MGYG_07127 [Nannizzia gypsea CBS 118893]|uniref:Uncharacterized protein n=1 Tax=Arthroderma gypseum (strain ATCC MYA-4604 / CBS 118893) TaxID=535722 RepID=E4V255_ARTGP|nr:hypothetical protein MGYG_07127 [Nannizzia gypsea CBS 118893]EFR04120.1 hypothetical protein MGYG_07127 [Nannizzia gypsea CBS 118893]